MKATKTCAVALFLFAASSACGAVSPDVAPRSREPLSRSILSSMAASDASNASSSSSQKVLPVRTRKVDVTDDLHGIKVTDPFRWLEDSESAEVKTWTDEQ